MFLSGMDKFYGLKAWPTNVISTTGSYFVLVSGTLSFFNGKILSFFFGKTLSLYYFSINVKLKKKTGHNIWRLKYKQHSDQEERLAIYNSLVSSIRETQHMQLLSIKKDLQLY